MFKNQGLNLKRRRQLPAFGVLPYQFDMEKIKTSFSKFSNYDHYTDLEPSADNSSYKSLCIARENLHKKFLSEEERQKAAATETVSSRQYRQLALTEFNGDISSYPSSGAEKPFLSYRRTSRRGSVSYQPMFDERNFTKRKSICSGYWNDVLDTFASKVTRTRFAYLAAGSKIQAHVDYDTAYSVRVHIPIVTNTRSFLFVRDLAGIVHKMHMPADGRAFFMNTGLTHWAENLGDTERVHLIVSINGQQDLRGLVEVGC